MGHLLVGIVVGIGSFIGLMKFGAPTPVSAIAAFVLALIAMCMITPCGPGGGGGS